MARDGKMTYSTSAIGANKEILNRSEFEGVAMTLDFTGVSTADADGDILIKAGTPISKVGAPITSTPWTGAVGVLLHDVYKTRPQGTVLKKAYINVTRANAASGLTYDGNICTEVAKAGGRIVLEAPITLPS